MDARERVLIIDDDGDLRAALAEYLRGMGLDVLEAADGESGLEAVRAHAPALVLLDLTMPGMDGYVVCRAIRAMPGAERTAVVVITGLAGTDLALRAFDSGAVDFITKPFHLQEVRARVRTHLEARRRGVALEEKGLSLEKAFSEAAAMNRSLLTLNDKLRKSEALKDRFLSLMRNEINNPLNDIIGLADRILDPALDPARGRELARLVRMEATRLDFQIRNVFCAAELEAGQARPTVSRVDVASVARDVADSCSRAAGSQHPEVRVSAEEAHFDTDGGMVHLILADLVANAALRSGPAGQVEVSVAVTGGQLRIRVADSGPALEEQARQDLFRGFGGGDGSGLAAPGLGLILPVVKALADLLDGSVSAENLPGGGAAFEVRLPPGTFLDHMDAESMDGNLLIFDDPQAF
ncbi:hybrid sensor histidine kinase/response regulator [Mesoterricola sediminis]|uniref:histidine kinase n=1 Tax=Mesoterricola sediminis TaxID=2927980 RepID=A0AA48KAY2_9BACT|nr:hybrid sensor histidine kinase/response regulator [Mesoterricola sediminis]BDU75544.1 hybrid sensor histidine kinase/response regulator [Mesoterricola sediminis]